MIKRIIIIAMFLVIMIPPVAAFGILKGDIDNSEEIDLTDAIISLQISAGMNVTVPLYTSAEVNGDGKIGTDEVIYILQTVAGLRPYMLVGIWDSSLWNNSLWGQ